jgi:large subunit ribosomal protein L6
MSRVGKNPIAIPSGVIVTVQGESVTVKGPKGELSQALVHGITAAVADGQVVVSRPNDSKQSRASHGLVRALVNNMVTGVSQGFERKLEVIGVGYRADVKGSQLVMNLGYSHSINYDIPSGVAVSVDKQNVITIQGIDKQRVGQVAAEVRAFRSPDSYKGKGVRYQGEYIRLKTGKSA